MPEIPLPVQEAVRDLFGDLLSKGCAVERAEDELRLAPGERAVIAEYVDADGAVAGAAIADLPFACRSGSALVMMPANIAEEAITAGEIDGDMLDCFKEVANVLSRLMNSAETPHVKLGGIFQAGQLIPGELRCLLSSPRRRDFTVDIEEYGQGRISVMTRPASQDAALAA